MAGGIGSTKEGGSLENTSRRCRQRFCNRNRRDWPTSEAIPVSECFKRRRKIEFECAVARSLAILESDILRIFTDSRDSDFHVIHECNIVKINNCVIKARSPNLHKILEPQFEYANNNIIKCYIERREIFLRIKHFSRLLYGNSDVRGEERTIVELILTLKDSCDSNERKCGNRENRNRLEAGRVESEDADSDLTSRSVESEMADSGLETGSLSPLVADDESEASLSNDDDDDARVTDCTSIDEDFVKIGMNGQVEEEKSASEKIQQENCVSSENADDREENSGPKNRQNGAGSSGRSLKNREIILTPGKSENLPFSGFSKPENGPEKSSLTRAVRVTRELDDLATGEILFSPKSEGKSENSPILAFSSPENGPEKSSLRRGIRGTREIGDLATGEISFPSNNDEKSVDPPIFAFSLPENGPENSTSSRGIRGTREIGDLTTGEILFSPNNEEKSADRRFISGRRKSSGSLKNYYFIDASSLNDDSEESAAPSATDNEEIFPAKRPICSRRVGQSGAEKMDDFLQQNPGKSEENRKIGKIEKEALVVEIKEADSGESNHPSPCLDNGTSENPENSPGNPEKSAKKSENLCLDFPTGSPEKSRENRCSVENFDENLPEKPVGKSLENLKHGLIRRNTFEIGTEDEEKMSSLRQEHERRQGHLIFQSSIPQYSGHRLDSEPFYDSAPENSSLPILPDLGRKNEPNSMKYSGPRFSLTQEKPVIADFRPENSSLPIHTDLSGKNEPNPKKYSSPRFSLTQEKLLIADFRPEIADFRRSRDSPEPISWSSDRPDDRFFPESCSESDDASKIGCNSLPITLSHPEILRGPGKRTKRDEATPIISGGASTADFSRPPESPLVKRKTDATPIVSGGSVLPGDPENRLRKPEKSRMTSSMTAWVVDMSDCGKIVPKIGNDRQQISMSQSLSESGKTKKISEPKHNSLGFFVNLRDPVEPTSGPSSGSKKVPECQKSCEFFVDFSSSGPVEPISPGTAAAGKEKKALFPGTSGDKKNIFHMFIDLKESEEKPSPENPDRKDSGKFPDRKIDGKSGKQIVSSDSGESSNGHWTPGTGSNGFERGKSGVFMFIESDSPVIRRRAMSSSRKMAGNEAAFQRHSWNVEKFSVTGTGNGAFRETGNGRKEHKRAHSLVSVDRQDFRKFQGKSSNSSRSLSEAAQADTLNNDPGMTSGRTDLATAAESSKNTSTEEMFDYEFRDTPPNSHVEVRKSVETPPPEPEIPDPEISKACEDENSEVWEKTTSTEGCTRKSETFDISSGPGSSDEERPDEIPEISKMDFPNSGNSTDFLEAFGDLTILETREKRRETEKSLSETLKKIETELGSVGNGFNKKDSTTNSSSTFVRLSDLDAAGKSRKSGISDNFDNSRIRNVSEEKSSYRLSNSIPEMSWIESKLAINRSAANPPPPTVARSFRKFGPPIMSTSLPAKNKSPLDDNETDPDPLVSESDLSSMQSSMGRSGPDVSTEETETSSMGVTKPYNRLGEDLLRMFLEEINPDVTIDVGGRTIRAHKCILSSRCQYFAAILSGGWIEKAGNVIALQGYSYNAVHFALCHIYSGESNIPETLSIVELATLADMLCLEGLKEVIGYTLKVKYCHLFHKPCQVCAVGVLECLPLAAAYGLDEIYRKSLRWITRHFVRIWPCKAFATMPRELMDKCYHQHIVHMSTDNVLQTMMDCDKLLATLPNVRWAEPVFRMISNLLETAVKFLSDNFSAILANENFQALGRDLTWNISRLEDNFFAAADRLPPDQACKSYSRISKMLAATEIEEPLAKPPWGPIFIDFLRKIQSRVEKSLVRDASRAARTNTWLKMDLDLRRRIQELACLVILPHEALKRPSRHSNFLKESRQPATRGPASRSLDLRRVKMAISEHNDKTTRPSSGTTAATATATTTITTTSSAPGTTQQVKKTLLIKPRSDPLERKIPQEVKQVVNDPVTLRPKSWPNKLEVKSRYLEPRGKPVCQQSGHERVIVQQRRKIIISSSDSSRTSSPAMKRAAAEKKVPAALKHQKISAKKDSTKALSSESLTSDRITGSGAKKIEPETSKSCVSARSESPSKRRGKQVPPQQQSTISPAAFSTDSLVEIVEKSQNRAAAPVPARKAKVPPARMDTSMSTDSLMGSDFGIEKIRSKSANSSNKVSPIMSTGRKAGTVTTTKSATNSEKSAKKGSQQLQGASRSPLTGVTARRNPGITSTRSLESSTAASRNRAAAISAYHGSPNLRRNLLEAAKTPDSTAKGADVPAKSAEVPKSATNGVPSRAHSRAVGQTSAGKRHEKFFSDSQSSTESPSKRSPKSNGTFRPRIVGTAKKSAARSEERPKGTKCQNGETPKLQQTPPPPPPPPTVPSRSGTFLKDEPTILKKSDIKNSQISSTT